MPTAPTRIKLSPCFSCHYFRIFTRRALFADVLTLPVRLRPPEMGIVVVIGVFCRYWEGVLSAEGENGAYCCNREGDFACGGWNGWEID